MDKQRAQTIIAEIVAAGLRYDPRGADIVLRYDPAATLLTRAPEATHTQPLATATLIVRRDIMRAPNTLQVVTCTDGSELVWDTSCDDIPALPGEWSRLV